MKRVWSLIGAAALALAATACSSPASAPTTNTNPPPTTTSSTATGTASPKASATPTGPVVEFSVDGAGPYTLGASLTALQAKPGLTEVSAGAPPCKDNTSARGTGVWKDVQLMFHSDGTLYLIINRSDQIPTPSGAWLGSTLGELKAIYAGVSTFDLAHGTDTAFLVQTLSGRGILFELNPGKQVSAMKAGDAAFLKASYQAGTDFC